MFSLHRCRHTKW